MSYKLKEAVFRVRCREQGCPFNSDFTVRQNIMGATEQDVDVEAGKIALNMAMTHHDAIYGRKHNLSSPEVRKVGGKYEQLGTAAGPVPAGTAGASVPIRHYKKGEMIIHKGERASTLCEVVRGSACNPDHPDIVYRTGSTFGAAALLENKSRQADIVACEDDTVIGFYNLRDISKTSPQKARELYVEAMEDIFNILVYLEDYSEKLEKQAARLKAENTALKEGAGKKPASVAKKTGKSAAKAPAKGAKRTAARK